MDNELEERSSLESILDYAQTLWRWAWLLLIVAIAAGAPRNDSGIVRLSANAASAPRAEVLPP